MKISEIETKKVVSRSALPDADLVINPYVGCQHACLYCYADFMRRFTGHGDDKWGEFVDVKTNAAATIPRKGFGEDTVLVGSVTDPYQQLEGRYQITRQILERILDFQPRLEILTKSALVTRDIDLLKQFKKLSVGISLNTLDRKVARQLEPFASSPQARIYALRQLYEAGIETYLFISPIFPGITDYQELIEATQGVVGKYLFENLNIRANNRTAVLGFIGKHFPDLKETYEGLSKDKGLWDSLQQEIERHCKSLGIEFKIYFNHKEQRK